MKKQEPFDISITMINESRKAVREEYIFLSNEFGILYNMEHLVQNLLTNRITKIIDGLHFSLNQPYRLKEGRIVLLLKGQATIRYNLMEYTITPSHIVVVPIGSIIQLLNVDPDTSMRMIGFGSDFIPFVRKEEHLEYYFGQQQNPVIPLTDKEFKEVENYFLLLWDTVQSEEFYREVIQHLLLAFLHFISYIRREYQVSVGSKLTHQENTFNRFIALVDKYSINQRTVGFYADKLCLTPRYLNTIIRQASGQTVMEWINQAIILEAKVLLKHSNLLIYQIADKLNFPNPSFFCKFFKRMTGITPQEYQKE